MFANFSSLQALSGRLFLFSGDSDVKNIKVKIKKQNLQFQQLSITMFLNMAELLQKNVIFPVVPSVLPEKLFVLFAFFVQYPLLKWCLHLKSKTL